MTRTYVITGAASGIGEATAALIREQGHRVIGVDVRDAEVVADLATPEGRRSLVEQVTELSEGSIDAVIANAGLMGPTVRTAAVNYFGAVATLDGLRPLLARSSAPRAVATVSGALLVAPDAFLLDAMLAGDETAALAYARELELTAEDNRIYATTKRALARWIRRQAPTPEWAGSGIALNAVAPGFVETPMVAEYLSAEGARDHASEMMPLGGIAAAGELAVPLAWLSSEENSQVTGQVIFVDGGVEVSARGDHIWDDSESLPL